MAIIRVGTNERFASGWDAAFGGSSTNAGSPHSGAASVATSGATKSPEPARPDRADRASANPPAKTDDHADESMAKTVEQTTAADKGGTSSGS